MAKCVTVAIAGLGSRGKEAYAKCAHLFPDRMKIVAVADIVPEKVENAAKEYHIPPEMCFESAEKMLERERLADVLFVCTLDRQHYPHAIPALKKGYHLLLEKPISPDLSECREIAETAQKYDRKVVVCHVLRYTPFYQKVKEIIDSGILGRVMHIEAVENVGYWHQAHSFVRGNWRNDRESPMILQKSCHDMDLLLWLSGKHCARVSSFGSLGWFKPENAPEGSAERCLDCGAREKCPYDAQKIYMTGKHGALSGYTGWPLDVLAQNPTPEKIKKALEEGPYGRCVYRCDNNVVDHQVVNLCYEDGATASFTMCAFNSGMSRTISVLGAMGELHGDMATETISYGPFGEERKTVDLRLESEDLTGHGGGDTRLIADLLDLLSGGKGSSLTEIGQSVESHFVALAAERSRLNGGEAIDMQAFSQAVK
ncbi:MAG: Gfo/Idh/MocA family oxidoreductase [Provencibacterium sp.]|jgi:predicted dehydrogenase|nr:Gfo/Idh/MocA family oxidoreductase [Provencibacterium sp.]